MQRLGSRNQTVVARSVSGPVVGLGGDGCLHASSSAPPQKLSRTFSEQGPLSNTGAATATASNNSSSSSNDINPLKSDPELQILLKRLDRIKKFKRFQGWKTRFLDRLEKFIYEEGMTPAQQACNDFDETLRKFVNRTMLVTEFMDKGELSNTRKTVKAALALNEMCSSLQIVVAEVETLVPYSGREEKKLGFSKFHSGCGLIRQNFHQYITMKVIEDALTEISQKADDVADRQQHELMDKYKVQVQRFCDIMADLGLYEVMMKCLEFSQEPEEDESEGSELINIVIQVIETQDGSQTTLQVEIEADESIQNLKEIIAPGCNIEPCRQVLKFRGVELAAANAADDDNNNKALEDFGIEDGSILTVEPFKIPITVKCSSSNGKVIQTMVDVTNELGTLKDQLQDASGIPSNNQKLSFNGSALERDNETIDFYSIQAGSVLTLGPKAITITVVMPNGNDQHTVEITPLDKSDDIKNTIAKNTGMAVHKQILKFHGEELPLLVNANEMGIQDGSILQLAKVPITVTTTMGGQQIRAMVDPTAKLRDIKVQLEKECGIPADNQSLLFNDGDVELDDDDKAAEDYGIQAGTALKLEPKSMAVTVEMPDGGQSSCTIDVKPSETIDAIKAKIEKATGMIVARQVLKVNGAELATDRTVTDMGIRPGTAITVEVFKVPITVTAMDGKVIHVMVDPTDKLSDIQEQLVNESGIPADNQNLFLSGDVLDGDYNKPARDYGIQAGTELKLEPKSMKVKVEMPDGKVRTMDLKPCDTGNDIKAKIKEETGMDVPRQVLKVKDGVVVVVIDNGIQTAKDMGIREGTAIQVEVFKVPVTITSEDGQEIKAMIEPGVKLEDMKLQLETVFG